MPTPVSAADLRRLKGDAQALRAESLRADPDSPLAQAKALDKVAQREGWANWALLQRSISTAGPVAAAQAMQLQVRPFEGGDAGVVLLSIRLTDRASQALLARSGGLVFALPPCPRHWILRCFTASVEAARNAKLPEWACPASIWTPAGWWTFCKTFGWQAPDGE